jgi:hypothetical protein
MLAINQPTSCQRLEAVSHLPIGISFNTVLTVVDPVGSVQNPQQPAQVVQPECDLAPKFPGLSGCRTPLCDTGKQMLHLSSSPAQVELADPWGLSS